MMFFYLPWIIASGWMSSQTKMAASTARPPVTSQTDDLV